MKKLRYFSGTPVAEGVRLEIDKYTVFAVRNAQRDISVRMRREPRKLLRFLMRVPLLRGIVRFIRNITRFFDGIGESHELEPQRPVRGTKIENALAKFLRVSPQSIVTLISAICLPILAFACLYAAPLGMETLLTQSAGASRAAVQWTTCAFRVLGFLAFCALAAHLRVFDRLLMYRGAINQAANCYESTGDVTVDAAAEYPRYARRSEPAFMIGVTVISIILFTLVPARNLWIYLPTRVGILLGVAALLGEPMRALENAELTTAVSVLRGPMDCIEALMTLPPDAEALEAAVCAFQAVTGDIEEIPDEEAEE